MYIIQVIRDIAHVLTEVQRFRLYLILVFFLSVAVIQLLGIASIAPFISMLSDPGVIQRNKIYLALYQFTGAESSNQFLVYFASMTLVLMFVSNFTAAFSMWVLLKFSIYIGDNLQWRLYQNILNRGYVFHKMHNYNDLISVIMYEAPRFVYMVLQQYLILFSQLFVAIIIFVGLLWVDVVVAISSVAIIGGAYLMTYLLVKKSLVMHGKVLTEKNQLIQKILSESLIGVKDIKLISLESNYVKRFSQINTRGSRSSAFIALAGDIPRFMIETISFGVILVLAIVLVNSTGSTHDAISMLTIYALAGYKLLPTLQQIYKSVGNLSAHGSVIEKLSRELSSPVETPSKVEIDKISVINQVALKNIFFRYPGNEECALVNASVTFKLGELNTIAGQSGSGKSTLADVLLGLLRPEAGVIEVNGVAADGDYMLSYQRSIGYVPQSIFILDDSIVANVAFGVPPGDVDLEKVRRALIQANAMEFVNRMPRGLESSLGQDGKLLSGGQRQRIGIARALYRDNRILILDEPTSALDIESEYELMVLLGELKKHVLVVVISHRPAAIKLSDTISIVESGSVVAHGSYEQLMRGNEKFNELMQKGAIL